jgi:drug/metabolite transporter (DMT)-like permease
MRPAVTSGSSSASEIDCAGGVLMVTELDAEQPSLRRQSSTRVAIAALVLACWGEAVGFVLMKAFALRSGLVVPGASEWFISAFLLLGRFLVAALLLQCVERKLPTWSECAQGLWIGGFAGAGHLLQMDALNWTSASTSAFLTQGYVVVLPIVAAVERWRAPERRVLFAVLLNLIGLAVLAHFDPRRLTLGRGEGETLLAALLFAGQIFSISRPRYAQNETGPVTLVMFLTIGLGAIPLAVATGRSSDFDRLTASSPIWLMLGLLAVLSTLLPFVLMNRYQRRVSSSEAGVIYGAEPVLASLLALFLPAVLSPIAGVGYANERVSMRLVLGASLVTLAPVLLRARNTDSEPRALADKSTNPAG